MREVAEHYSAADLTARILSALRDHGITTDLLNIRDLAPFDQFHTRGWDATLEMADLAQVESRISVLDIGCGVGGPARLLAQNFGCSVTGIDLTEDFVQTARRLSQLVGLSARTRFCRADALQLPFRNAVFDLAWTQHASMNIPDKDRLYREVWHVLKPGCRFAIYDIVQGPESAPHFPVPWAREPSISFLADPEEMRRLLEKIGFKIAVWQNASVEVLAWFRKSTEQGGPARPGLHLLRGPEWQVMVSNVIRNFEEGRIQLLKAVMSKP